MPNHSWTHQNIITRRNFLRRTSAGLGSVAVASLLNPNLFATASSAGEDVRLPHFAPKAKRVIYLFMSGGPSHIDLLDYKPKLRALQGTELPESVRGQKRLTLMTRNQSQFPVAASVFKFVKHGQSGQEMCELLPHLGEVADDV